MPRTPHHITLLGGGGHALVVAEAAQLEGYSVQGVYDDNPVCAATQSPHPSPYLGPLEAFLQHPRDTPPWILCLGDCRIRRTLLNRLSNHNCPPATIVHPRAFVSPSATLAPGTFVGPLAVVHACARIAPHAIINSAAIIEHHCTVSENAHIAPNATLGGNVSIGADTLVGLGAAVLPGVRIGSRCVVGAGAVVRQDVPDACRVAAPQAHYRLAVPPEPLAQTSGQQIS
ncbi:MAG: acetyltransferase [Planctomycetota bacterium]|nr:acetyltransferase [Planctomycetota bacterium]